MFDCNAIILFFRPKKKLHIVFIYGMLIDIKKQYYICLTWIFHFLIIKKHMQILQYDIQENFNYLKDEENYYHSKFYFITYDCL